MDYIPMLYHAKIIRSPVLIFSLGKAHWGELMDRFYGLIPPLRADMVHELYELFPFEYLYLKTEGKLARDRITG